MVLSGIPVVGSTTRMAPFWSNGETLAMAVDPLSGEFAVESRGDLCGRLLGSGAGAQATGIERCDAPRACCKEIAGSLRVDHLGQVGFEGADETLLRMRWKAFNHHAVDVNVHLAGVHSQPRVSAAPSGFSSLAYSVRAAVSTWRMAIAACSSAARNAASNAMLRMTPPVTFNCARRGKSSE